MMEPGQTPHQVQPGEAGGEGWRFTFCTRDHCHRCAGLRVVALRAAASTHGLQQGCPDEATLVVTRTALDDVADRLDAAPIDGFATGNLPPDADPVLRRLATLLQPALDSARGNRSLFVDHLQHAVAVHVAVVYGGMVPGTRARRGGLATWQLRRAQELMRANLDESVRLEEVADACRLSVSHFSRAFRRSTGMAPYAWLQKQRVEAAKALLRARTSSLSDVAIACGFSDQSHFTRVFHRQVGASPGAWRRVVAVPAG